MRQNATNLYWLLVSDTYVSPVESDEDGRHGLGDLGVGRTSPCERRETQFVGCGVVGAELQRHFRLYNECMEYPK